jgi:hypothetical protein
LLNLTTIRQAIYTWVNSVISPVPAMWADQNASQPAAKFVSIRIQSITNVSRDVHGPIDDETAVAQLYGTREIIISVRGFGDGSNQLLELLSGSLEKVTVQDTLRASGLAVVSNGNVLNLSGLLESGFKEQSSLDVTFRTSSVDSDNLGLIEAVEVEATTERPPAQDIVKEFTVGTPYP